MKSSLLLPSATIALGALFLASLIAACSSEPSREKFPYADPAVDAVARALLADIVNGDLQGVRRRLNQHGRDSVTAETMARIFQYFPDHRAPLSVTLSSGEVADSHEPTPAVRHRLTYRLGLSGEQGSSNESRLWYFFELTVEGGDSLVTGFRLEE